MKGGLLIQGSDYVGDSFSHRVKLRFPFGRTSNTVWPKGGSM